MATVKVKLRPSTVPGKAGTIYYQLTHLRQVKQITTKIHLHPQDWDSNKAQIIFTDSTSYLLQCKIDRDLDRLKKIIYKIDAECANYTVNEIIEKFYQTTADYSITDFFTQQIQKLKNDNRRGTARNYSKTLKSLKAFMKNTDSTFNIVTEQFVESYNTFLIQRGVVRNTISFYMRIFRSVYNKAVTQKIIEQTFPFKNVYTGVDRTRKRAVTETVISQLLSIDLKKSKALQFARDLFIFSFYARGMAFVDIVYLKKSNIQNGYITYVRHKTGQELTIRIETRLQNIINQYEKKDSPYLFPILNTEDENKAYSQYEIALNYYNRQLKRLSKLLEPNINLSSYTPRHTWATTARNKNVPLSIISAGMGHSSEKTTLIILSLSKRRYKFDAKILVFY
ncbi:site-specific integrase [Phocaeicola dorei]|uniref:site-specific integrase n=1 Tax=Phocaeicola dorei TaxID=357276 RepID=UPI000B3A9074|nr:site-specific integrase [Phocaeicola dorei]OUP93282.1 integrase [Phocaeicola dorei]